MPRRGPATSIRAINLFTSSAIALNPDTGKMVGYHQYHQNNSWDWDRDPATDADQHDHDGQTFDALVHPGRDGYLWVLQQTDGGIGYVYGKRFVYQNAFKSLDRRPGGRPTTTTTSR